MMAGVQNGCPTITATSGHPQATSVFTVGDLEIKLVDSKVTSNNVKPAVKRPTTSKRKPATQRSQSKKAAAADQKKLVLAKRCNRDNPYGDLFNYRLYSDSDDDDHSTDSESQPQLNGNQLKSKSSKPRPTLIRLAPAAAVHRHQRHQLPSSSELPLPNISLTTDDCDQLDIGKLRNKMLSQKWLLINWIDIRRRQLRSSLIETALSTKRERSRIKSTLDVLLEARSTRVSSCPAGQPPTVDSLRKGTCSFVGGADDRQCLMPSLPFTRHCQKHILYNVDQLLYTRCTAKCSETLMPCTNPTLDIAVDEPLCDLHLQEQVEAKEQLKENGRTTRRRGKALPLTRTARRKRTKSLPEKGGTDISNNHIAPADIAASPDMGSMPHIGIDLQPNEEALVAQIVAQLPIGDVGVSVPGASSSIEAELTDVFNKIPDDAFNELFFADNLKNGEAATTLVHDNSTAGFPPIDQALTVKEPNNLHSLPNLIAPPHLPTANGTASGFGSLPPVHTIVSTPPSVINEEASQPLLTQIPELVHPSSHPLQTVIPSPDPHQTAAGSPVIGTAIGPRPPLPGGQPLNENDIFDVASTVFANLTTEQQQQLNGLIDGALASGSLSTSPTLRTALNGW